MKSLEPILKRVREERKKTAYRVRSGELPFMVSELPYCARVALLVEEIGEVAECAKALEGLKNRLRWTEEQALAKLDDELIQLVSILFDWLTEAER